MALPAPHPEPKALTPEAAAFYVHCLDALHKAEVPFLVGGAYALERYTGISRDTKDADLFLLPADAVAALEALGSLGYRTELTFPHWLGKAFCGDDMLDLIFSSGNAVARVDDEWFAHARDGEVFGRPTRLIPPEEMIWSKAFVQERERFDGADIAHVIRACGREMDWDRVLRRFGEHWRVLLGHLVMFGFAYPGERTAVPARVIRDLLTRLDGELDADGEAGLCRGTLVSRQQYLIDVDRWGYADARVPRMSADDIARWTADIR